MKIVVAMDSYKGCLTAREACQAVATGIQRVKPGCQCVVLPVSDGGDGMLGTIDCDIETITVTGPLPGMTVDAQIGYTDDGTAIIESAQACGLALLSPEQRNPMRTTTVGVGQMIVHAARKGHRRIVIGLGGSATNDVGAGMLRALGMKFLDFNGEILEPCGGNLGKIARVEGIDEVAKSLDGIEVIAACDVNNPLYGQQGAAAVYAPQKGATTAMVEELDCGAQSLARLINEDTALYPGAGAAGGLGYAIMAMCGGRLVPGATLLLDLLGFDKMCQDADLVITGEGRSDRQTLMGKIPSQVMERARMRGVKTALLSGGVRDEQELLDAGFCSVKRVTPESMPLEMAMRPEVAMSNLENAAAELVTQIALSTQV